MPSERSPHTEAMVLELARLLSLISLASLLSLAACGGTEAPSGPEGGGPNTEQAASTPPASPTQDASADGLRALMQRIREVALAGKTTQAAELVRGLALTEASIAKALKDGSEETAKRILEGMSKMWPTTDEGLAAIFGKRPERSEIQVHAATTEELAAASTENPAVGEFPGGAIEAAKKLLRPGMTFYEVEFVEPGQSSGLKFHLFFHDGKQWRMLAKVWRYLADR
jgi:hypothetical protein